MAIGSTTNGLKHPLWTKVMGEIQGRIDRGFYALGSVLPREVDLAEELNVSRNTIRHAMSQLVIDGFLERRKKGGTRIASLGPSMKFRVDLDPQSSLKVLSQGSELEVLHRQTVALPAKLRELWPSADEGKWHEVSCIRLTSVSRKPLSVTQVYLAPDLEDVSLLIGSRRGQQFRLIEEQHHEHMIRTKTSLEPIIIADDLADTLKLPHNVLAMEVVHAMIDNHNAAREIVVSIYPAERYKFELSFSLENEI